jgi:hypothetical protein
MHKAKVAHRHVILGISGFWVFEHFGGLGLVVVVVVGLGLSIGGILSMSVGLSLFSLLL